MEHDQFGLRILAQPLPQYTLLRFPYGVIEDNQRARCEVRCSLVQCALPPNHTGRCIDEDQIVGSSLGHSSPRTGVRHVLPSRSHAGLEGRHDHLGVNT